MQLIRIKNILRRSLTQPLQILHRDIAAGGSVCVYVCVYFHRNSLVWWDISRCQTGGGFDLLLMMNSRGGSRPPPQSQTNIYFLRVAPPVSWVHIEFLTRAWRCLWKVITYWMFFFFIQLLEGKIHLLHPEIVWRNHVSSSPQTQPFTSTSKQVEQCAISAPR